ncbi:MAG: DUF2336 domain-containing protein [Pseudomonadota bacterium]
MSEPLPINQDGVSGRARRTLLRRLIDYVALPASNVAPQDRSMGGDILLDMLFHASDDERRLCAQRLARMREAPRRVLRYLAQCRFEIAESILLENEAFDGSDLAGLVEQVSLEHRLAIAKRKHVQPIVTEKLAKAGEPAVLTALLSNRGADLSETAIDILVARSRKEQEICGQLIKRLELRPAQAMAMFWWSDGPTRRVILNRHAADRLEMIEMCADVFAMAAEEGWRDPVARKTLQLIERRQRNRAAIEKSPYDSLEHAITVAALEGLNPEIAQEIGYLAGVKPVTIAKILSDHGGEGLAVLCKATGLKRGSLEDLWRALRRPLEISDGEPHPQYAYLLETYELLTVARAQTTLRYWNWSLSSTFSPNRLKQTGVDEDLANDEAAFSSARRTAKLVFGQ